MKGAQEEKKGKTNESFVILTLERKREKGEEPGADERGGGGGGRGGRREEIRGEAIQICLVEIPLL